MAELDSIDLHDLPLSTYVDRLIDAIDRFFTDYPGYHAIFMQVQGTISELEELDRAADLPLIQNLAASLSKYDPDLAAADRDAISFVLVKAIGTLLWLSLSQEPTFRHRLVVEAKRFTFNYLHSYFPSDK